MSTLLLATLAITYLICLAIVDSLVNRLVFRKDYNKSYFSKEKLIIYENPNWLPYCLLFLIVLPILIPVTLAFLIGGVRYIIGYIALLCLVEWDMIFGKLVFGGWFKDKPSIRLPLLGWVHFNLWVTMAVRLIIAVICLVLIF